MFATEFIEKIIVLLAVGAERHLDAYLDVQVLTQVITAATILTEGHCNNMVTA